MKKSTAPILKAVLCYKIAQWCHMAPAPVPIIPDDEVGEIIRDAIEDQHIIGWDNFLKGRISIKWKHAQALYIEALPTHNCFNKELWSSKVVTAIWSIFRLVWNSRNAHLHTDMMSTYGSVLNLQIRRAFRLRHSMFSTDQLLFHMSLQDRLLTSPTSKAMWLESVKIAVHDFTIIHKRSPCQRTITDFFQRQSTTDLDSDIPLLQVPIPTENDTDFIPVLI